MSGKRGRRRGMALWGAMVLAVGALAAGCGSSSSSGSASASGGGSATGGGKLTTLKFGLVTGAMNSQPIWLAMQKGYFAKEGIKLDIVDFQSGAAEVSALSTGQIDASAGTESAGLFNAISGGVPVRYVADASTDAPAYGVIVVRKSLVQSGQYKGPQSLKGRTVAVAGLGIEPEWSLYRALHSVGLGLGDVRLEALGFPQQIAALAGGSLDAAVMIEPAVHNVVTRGVAVPAIYTNKVTPDNPIALLEFSGKLIKQPALATRFMVAYIKGDRLYNQGLNKKTGTLAHNATGDLVAKVMSQYSKLGPPSLFKTLHMNNVNPNGQMRLDLMTQVLDFFKQQGLVKNKNVVVSDAVDTQFVNAALRQLGKQ